MKPFLVAAARRGTAVALLAMVAAANLLAVGCAGEPQRVPPARSVVDVGALPEREVLPLAGAAFVADVPEDRGGEGNRLYRPAGGIVPDDRR